MNADSIIAGVLAAVDKKAQPRDVTLPKGLEVKSFAEAKFVHKPWGFELWLSDATDMPFALKIIHLKAGTKTSLQYHEKKKECNCLLAGSILLHYKDEQTGDIKTMPLEGGEVIRVWPPTVHRVEALTDVLLVEASTSELDDVIRIEDDFKRPHGKIISEHQSA